MSPSCSSCAWISSAGQRVVLVQWWPPRGCPTSQQIQTHTIQAAGVANPGCTDCTHRWSPSWRGPRRECRRARSARTYDRTESMHSNLKTAGIRSNTNRQPGGGGSRNLRRQHILRYYPDTHSASTRRMDQLQGRAGRCANIIEAPWLVNGGHGASLNRQSYSAQSDPIHSHLPKAHKDHWRRNEKV
jgi:hypothetical protein